MLKIEIVKLENEAIQKEINEIRKQQAELQKQAVELMKMKKDYNKTDAKNLVRWLNTHEVDDRLYNYNFNKLKNYEDNGYLKIQNQKGKIKIEFI